MAQIASFMVLGLYQQQAECSLPSPGSVGAVVITGAILSRLLPFNRTYDPFCGHMSIRGCGREWRGMGMEGHGNGGARE